jgi:hypothetical protein
MVAKERAIQSRTLEQFGKNEDLPMKDVHAVLRQKEIEIRGWKTKLRC